MNYWQKEVIRLEHSLKGTRHFTRFRVWLIEQSDNHPSVVSLVDADALTEAQLNRLLEHGGARMRRVVDRSLYVAVLLLWALFLLVSAVAAIKGGLAV